MLLASCRRAFRLVRLKIESSLDSKKSHTRRRLNREWITHVRFRFRVLIWSQWSKVLDVWSTCETTALFSPFPTQETEHSWPVLLSHCLVWLATYNVEFALSIQRGVFNSWFHRLTDMELRIASHCQKLNSNTMYHACLGLLSRIRTLLPVEPGVVDTAPRTYPSKCSDPVVMWKTT